MGCASSGVATAPRPTMLATRAGHSDFCRLADATRSRSWQAVQRASTRSLPAPLGSATGVADAAGVVGPKLAAREAVTRSAPRAVHWAPPVTILLTCPLQPSPPSPIDL